MDGKVVAEIALPAGDPGAVRDAASALRGVAGGFSHMGATIDGAAASLTSWEGIASISFNHACVTFKGSADQADTACTAAAHALSSYATKLDAAIKQVEGMQKEAADLLETERNANATADTERTALMGAHQTLRMAAFDAAVDGGAALHSAQAEVTRHSDALGTATKAAGDARDRIEALKREAAGIREDVDADGTAAAGQMNAAMGELPTVDGAPTGSVGGTPLTSQTAKNEVAVTIVFVRIGANEAVMKEHTADGKWKVTKIEGVEGGVEFDPVPGAGVDGGKDAKVGRMGAGADVEAAFVAQYKHGETFTFTNERDADRFIEYRDKSLPHPIGAGKGGVYLPRISDSERRNIEWADDVKPDSTYDEGGVRASGKASGGGAEVGANGEAVLGHKVNTADGSTTTYSKASGSLSGSVSEGPLSAGGKISGETVTALTRTDDGRPTTYSVTVSGAAEGSAGANLPGEHGTGTDAVKHAITGSENHGYRIERQTTLDLNDPANRQAVENYVNSGGQDPQASQALADRLHDAGRVDVRHYDTGSSSVGANVDTKIVKVEASHTDETSLLTEMHHHGAGSHKTVETVP